MRHNDRTAAEAVRRCRFRRDLTAERANEPAWLAERRRRSWAAFEAAKLAASNKDEEWMRTDIRLFKPDQVLALAAERRCGPIGRRAACSHGVDLGGRVESVNGRARPFRELDAETSPHKGVVFGGLGQAVVEHGDVLREGVRPRGREPDLRSLRDA